MILVAGCTPDGPDPGGLAPEQIPRGGSIVVGVHGEPPTLDPYSPLASPLTRVLVRPAYPSLYRLAPDGTPEPYLAEDLQVQGSKARVRLQGWRWSNGRPITARDVVASVERALPPSGFVRVARARADGSSTVVLTGRGVVDWEGLLATAAYVLPKGKAGKAYGGPFRITRITPGLGFTYAPNPEWSEAPYLDSVIVRYVITLEIMMELLERGRLDAAWLPSSINLESRLDERELNHDARLGWESVEVDLEGWGRSADEIRRLVSDLDRNAIERGFIRGDGRIADTLAPGPGPDGADGPFRGLERGPGGVTGTLQLAAPIGDELLEDTQRLLQTQLDGDGLDVELVNVEPRTLYGDWSAEHSVDAILRRRLGAPSLLRDTGSPADPRTIPLFHVESVVAWGPRVTGPVANPTLDGPFWNLEHWYLPEEAPGG